MPKSDEVINKNAAFRSARRQKRRDSQSRDSARSRRGRERRLSIRSELRETPDMSKIARAVIALAMAQAETDAKAQADADATASGEPADE